MWTLETIAESDSSIIGVKLLAHGQPMTFGEVLGQWQSNTAFAAFWSSSLRALPFAAYFWETPPFSLASMGEPFECVFIDSPALARIPTDADSFIEHFVNQSPANVVVFESLGKDSILVAPSPVDDTTDYAHLAAFNRTASADQMGAFWKEVARTVDRRLGPAPIWLSTSGLGVSWLHVRLDSRPKYYQYRRYASPRFRARSSVGLKTAAPGDP